MCSYNEVELRTRNITACDQEMVTFSGESKKNIVEGCSISAHMTWIEKLLSHLNQTTIVKKKVGYRILELETTKEQAVARALFPWEQLLNR